MRKKINLIFLIIPLLLFGCNNYDLINKYNDNYPPINPLPNEDELEVKLFYPNKQLTHLIPEVRTINRDINDLNFIVIEELFRGTNKKGLINVIPKNLKLLSIDVLEGTAYVNLSGNIKDHIVSEKEEAFILYSIVNTLCSLGKINSVQFLIEGQASDKFINVYSIKEPLSYSSLIVKEHYINVISIIRKYYGSIVSNDFGNLLKLLHLQKYDYSILGMFKADFNTVSKNIDDFKIESYVINRYDDETEIIVDLILYDKTKYSDIENIRVNTRFNLTYEDKSFKIKLHDY